MRSPKFILLLMLLSPVIQSLAPGEFKAAQLKFPRVKEAFEDKGSVIDKLLSDKFIKKDKLDLMLVAYKTEKDLELWAANSPTETHTLIKTYKICAESGGLGPKRKEGDGQIPEGLYHIDRFNPASNFHLSLGLNYPNASDKIISDKKHPGGDIFIHGNCVSIGCLAMTDDKIKEIYPLAVLAKNAGQAKIPVYIFPKKMDVKGMAWLRARVEGDEKLAAFWNNLHVCYDRFQATKQPVPFTVDATGKYLVK